MKNKLPSVASQAGVLRREGAVEPGEMPFMPLIHPEGWKCQQVHQTVKTLTSRMFLCMNAPESQQNGAHKFSRGK